MLATALKRLPLGQALITQTVPDYFRLRFKSSLRPYKNTLDSQGIFYGAKEASFLEHLYNIAQWIFEHGKSELFALPELVPLPPEKLLPEKRYAF